MGGRPWTPEEHELVRALPPGEAARRTGRRLRTVYARRYNLGLCAALRWTQEEDGPARTLPAKEVARRTGRTLAAVYERRRALGVARRHPG
jgi:hypothetical protein